MKYHHEKRRTAAVSEPVQVYLDSRDRARLERLTERLRATKSAVLREALEALERQLTDVEHHPALEVIGIAAGPEIDDEDPAREHDRLLADQHEGGHVAPKPSRRRAR